MQFDLKYLKQFIVTISNSKILPYRGTGTFDQNNFFWNFFFHLQCTAQLPVFMRRSHIPKFKIAFPSEVLVSSD